MDDCLPIKPGSNRYHCPCYFFWKRLKLGYFYTCDLKASLEERKTLERIVRIGTYKEESEGLGLY